MELSNSFDMPCPIEEAWALLTDVERIAPCVPGAQLQEVDGDVLRGVVKMRFGRFTANYSGSATVVEAHHTDHKLVLSGQGLDAPGEGNAEAFITARLEPVSDTTTRVNVDTDLTITGRVASLGKGVIAGVGDTLIEQFAENLGEVLGETSEPAARRPPLRGRVEMPEPEAIDMLDAARAPLLKRVLGVVAVAAVLWLLRRRRR